MSRALDDLTDRFKPKAIELIARSAEAGIPVMIVDTLRTQAEQAINVAKGVSATLASRHLPLRQRINAAMTTRLMDAGEITEPDLDRSDAIDLAPYAIFQAAGPDKLNWDATDPVFLRIGQIGEALGLRWGGRWRQPVDPGHFEWVDSTSPSAVAQWNEEKARGWMGRQRVA